MKVRSSNLYFGPAPLTPPSLLNPAGGAGDCHLCAGRPSGGAGAAGRGALCSHALPLPPSAEVAADAGIEQLQLLTMTQAAGAGAEGGPPPRKAMLVPRMSGNDRGWRGLDRRQAAAATEEVEQLQAGRHQYTPSIHRARKRFRSGLGRAGQERAFSQRETKRQREEIA